MEFITQPWAWYVGGPIIAFVMFLLFYFGERFGISSNLETFCSIGGAGKYIEVRGASAFLNHNGTDYAASNALTLETGSIYVSSTTSNSFIPSSADRIEEFKKVTTATATFNVPLKVRGSGNATGNGGTIDIFLEYVIIDTN